MPSSSPRGVLGIVVVGERAPWWAVAVAAGVAMAIALDPLLIALGAVALVAALWAGSSSTPRPLVLAASVGVTCNVLCRAELFGRLGLSAAISLAVLALVFVTGIRHRSKVVRRVVWIGLGVLVVLGGASSAALGYAAYESRHELGAGQSTAELGVVALQEGDFASAADWFRQSADILDRAHARLDSPLTKLAAAVPIVAQHRAAVVDMSGAGASGAHVVEQALGEIDLDSLRTSGGRIDPAALAALEPPLVAVRARARAPAGDDRRVALAVAGAPCHLPARRLHREHRRAPADARPGDRRHPPGPAAARGGHPAHLPRAVHDAVGVTRARRDAGDVRRAAHRRRGAVAR